MQDEVRISRQCQLPGLILLEKEGSVLEQQTEQTTLPCGWLDGVMDASLIPCAIHRMQTSVVTLPSWPTCCVNADVRLHCNPPSLSAFVRILAYPPSPPWCGSPLWTTPNNNKKMGNFNKCYLVDISFAELKLIAESHEALAKSRIKFVDEGCRKAQERVRRYTAIRSLKKEIEQRKARDEQKLQELLECREEMQRFDLNAAYLPLALLSLCHS